MRAEGLEDKLRAIAEPFLLSLGMELVDIGFVSEHGRKILRLFIDKPGGVTLDDCSSVSREFGTILDVQDVMPSARYVLEVSSPGLDRPLIKEKDFIRFAGKRARIRTKAPIDGRRNFQAVIKGVEGGCVLIEDFDGKSFRLSLPDIDKANLIIEF